MYYTFKEYPHFRERITTSFYLRFAVDNWVLKFNPDKDIKLDPRNRCEFLYSIFSQIIQVLVDEIAIPQEILRYFKPNINNDMLVVGIKDSANDDQRKCLYALLACFINMYPIPICEVQPEEPEMTGPCYQIPPPPQDITMRSVPVSEVDPTSRPASPQPGPSGIKTEIKKEMKTETTTQNGTQIKTEIKTEFKRERNLPNIEQQAEAREFKMENLPDLPPSPVSSIERYLDMDLPPSPGSSIIPASVEQSSGYYQNYETGNFLPKLENNTDYYRLVNDDDYFAYDEMVNPNDEIISITSDGASGTTSRTITNLLSGLEFTRPEDRQRFPNDAEVDQEIARMKEALGSSGSGSVRSQPPQNQINSATSMINMLDERSAGILNRVQDIDNELERLQQTQIKQEPSPPTIDPTISDYDSESESPIVPIYPSLSSVRTDFEESQSTFREFQTNLDNSEINLTTTAGTLESIETDIQETRNRVTSMKRSRSNDESTTISTKRLNLRIESMIDPKFRQPPTLELSPLDPPPTCDVEYTDDIVDVMAEMETEEIRAQPVRLRKRSELRRAALAALRPPDNKRPRLTAERPTLQVDESIEDYSDDDL